MRAMLLLVLAVLMAMLIAPVHGSAAPAVAHRPCARGSLVFSSWRIPGTNGRSGWRPLAVDGSRVVMVEGPGDMVARPGPLTMALVTAGSARYRPIPSGAYPHAGVLQRWQLSWPWLVGVFNLQSPPTLGWTLWAGNLQTGTHIVLDRGHEVGKSGTMHAFPDFDLSDRKVVWTWTSYSLRPNTPMRNRIALYDLAEHRTTFLGIPVSPRRYTNPTLWGTRVVWERYTDFTCTHTHCPNHLIDLQLYDLATHHLQTLTHSSFRLGSSFSPGLWHNDLVFLHGYDANSGGTIIMVDLSSRVRGHHRFWWENFHSRVLQRRPAIELSVRDGLVSWDGGVADLVTGGTAALPLGEEQWSGGRSLVVQPITYAGPAPYTLLRVEHRCRP